MRKAHILVLDFRGGDPIRPVKSKDQGIQRRKPQQARAEATVELIFEASARILQTEGRDGLTTNKVAQRAGVSIGTLYAYFPDKEAILLAMARRETQLVRRSVEKALSDRSARTTEEFVRLAVKALIKGYGHRNRARRILMETLIASGGSDEIAAPVQAISDLISARRGQLFPQGSAEISKIGLFVLTRAVDSVVRAATYEDAPFIGSKDFEDELTLLVLAYVSAGRGVVAS